MRIGGDASRHLVLTLLSSNYTGFRLRLPNPSPARPMPRSASVAGSGKCGTGGGSGVGVQLEQGVNRKACGKRFPEGSPMYAQPTIWPL